MATERCRPLECRRRGLRRAGARSRPCGRSSSEPSRTVAPARRISCTLPTRTLALHNARDVYTRRQEGVSIWVVPAAAITASSPDEKDAFFDPRAISPTGIPRSTTSRRKCSTCESGRRTYALRLGDDALILSHRLAEWAARAPGSRRTSRSPTSGSTCSGRRGCCSRTPARSRAPAAMRTILPTSATSVTSSTCSWSSLRRRLRLDDCPTAAVLELPVGAVRGVAEVDRRHARSRRREGREGSRLPPRPCNAVDVAPRRRHRRQPSPDARWA